MRSTPATPLSLATMSPAQTYESADGDHPGPHPSFIQLARLFISETRLQEELKAVGVPESREDAMRLQGVTWIDNTRKALRLPVRTFDTAVAYYHRFRLAQPDDTYTFIDTIAAAALFTACKIEDTQKRSRDILCAAHNLKVSVPSEQLTPDDPRFEAQSKSVVSLERLMLESSAFDFRSTSPQKLVIKLSRTYSVNRDTVGRTAYAICTDLYRTFAPLKQTSQTLALACVELAGRLHSEPVKALEECRGYRRWRTSREQVMETTQDLLELYIQHGSKGSTLVGQTYTVEEFIAVRIPLNQEASKEGLLRYCQPYESKTSSSNGTGPRQFNGRSGPSSGRPSPTSPRDSLMKTPGANNGDSPSTPRRAEREARQQGTVRFMLDGESAREEKTVVDKFFKIEEEEIEIEEEIEESKLRSQEREREQREQREQRERDRTDRDSGRGGRGRGGGGWDRDRGDRHGREARFRGSDRDRDNDRFRESHYDRDHNRRRP